MVTAIAVRESGYREVIRVAEGAREDKEGWSNFLAYLEGRGLSGVQLFISAKCIGLDDSIAQYFRVYILTCRAGQKPSGKAGQFPSGTSTAAPYRSFLSQRVHGSTSGSMPEAPAMLNAIHVQEDRAEAMRKAESIGRKLRSRKLNKAAEMLKDGMSETLSYMRFPPEHWRNIRTNYPLGRVN